MNDIDIVLLLIIILLRNSIIIQKISLEYRADNGREIARQ